MADALEAHKLQLVSLHGPTSRDVSAMRESAMPLSICEVERVRRIEAMDELKRVIDVADDLPYARLILHMGGARENADPRKRDATLILATRISLIFRKTSALKKVLRRCTISCRPCIFTTIMARRTNTCRPTMAPSIGLRRSRCSNLRRNQMSR